MAIDNRRQSRFPDRGPAVSRNRGIPGWGDALTRMKSKLERLEAAQKERERPPSRPKRAKPGAKGGRRLFRTLLIVAAVLYGFSHLSGQLFEFVASLGDLENFVSGNGDEQAERIIAEREAAARRNPKSPLPANGQTGAAQDKREPSTPRRAAQTSAVAAALIEISELPHYPGATTMLEDKTIAVYVTTDPVQQVADTTFTLLQDAGWQGSLTAQNQEMRHLTFTRGQQELTAYISIAPRLGNRTSIQYHMVK